MANVPVNASDAIVVVDVVSDGQTIFDYDFRVDDVADLRAIYRETGQPDRPLAGGADFSASGIGSANGGTINLTSFVDTVAGASITIYRDTVIKRLTDFTRDLFADALNLETDHVFMIMQELRRQIASAITTPPGSPPPDITGLLEAIAAIEALFPPIEAGEEGYLLTVKDDLSGYEHTPPSGGGGGDAATLGGQPGAYYLKRENHSGTQSIAATDGLQAALDGKAATSHTHPISQVSGLQAALDAKAALNSPNFTGVPTAPTADGDDDSQQVANMAAVQAAIILNGGGGGGPGGGDADTLNGQPGAFYRNRANHTGTQAISTVDGLSAALASIGGTYQTKAALAAATVPAGLGSILLLGYTTAGDCPPAMLVRAAGINSGNAQSYHFPDASGDYWIIKGPTFDPKQLGVVGDYNTNDSVAFQRCLDFFAATQMPCHAGPMNIGVVGSFDLPEGFRIVGAGPANIHTWYTSTDKGNIRPGFKHLVRGTNIWLKGAATKTYNTNRSDGYSSMTYGLLYGHQTGGEIRGIGIIQDMDVRSAGGSLTNAANTNASNYQVGLIVRAYAHFMRDCRIFGYWGSGKASYVLHSQQSYIELDSDYCRHENCDFTGVALIASDEDTGDTNQGLTGSTWINCGMYSGADHHTPADGTYNKPPIFIDGDNGILGIRGHRWIGGNLRSRNNEIIKLDRCDNVCFEFAATETPILDGVPGADTQGKIVGTTVTGNVRIIAHALSSVASWGMNELANTILGSLIAIGGQSGQEVLICRQGKGTRIDCDPATGDSRIQISRDFTSYTNDWVIARDHANQDTLRYKYDNVQKFSFDRDGNMEFVGSLVSTSGDADIRAATGGVVRGRVGATSVFSANASLFNIPSGRISLGGADIIAGTGNPIGLAVVAPVGSIYLRLNGGANTTLYVKESGTDGTGWVAK